MLAEAFGYTLLHTSAHHPETNGMLERWHRYLKERLKLHALDRNIPIDTKSNGYAWDWILPSIVYSYNHTPNKMTGFAPFELVFAEKPKMAANMPFQLKPTTTKETPDIQLTRKILNASLKELHQVARMNQHAYNTQRQKYELKRTVKHKFKTGDTVFIDTSDAYVGNKAKFGINRDGPFKIISWNPNGNPIIEQVNTKERKSITPTRLVQATVPSINLIESEPLKKLSPLATSLIAHINALLCSKKRAKPKPTETLTTPITLAQFIAAQLGAEKQEIYDLMAGDGAITRHIETKHKISAIERDKERYTKGRQSVPYAEWKNVDIFSAEFVNEHIETNNTLTSVVANPEFGMAMPALIIAVLLVNRNPKATIIFLLPSNFFEARSRYHVYTLLPVYIEKEFRVGRWSYIGDKRALKREHDSVFVFRYKDEIRKAEKNTHPTYMREFGRASQPTDPIHSHSAHISEYAASLGADCRSIETKKDGS